MIRNEYIPKTFYHPCKTLSEKLEELEMGTKEFAIRTGKPEKTITAILSGKSSITSEMAILFENVLKIPAKFWLRSQANFDEACAREKRTLTIQEAIEWAKNFPYSEMAKFNWVKSTKKIEEKVIELFSFFGVASKSGWENYYLNSKLKVAFRISLKSTKKPEALSAWLRAGELQAENLIVKQYNEELLKHKLVELKKIMNIPTNEYFTILQKTLSEIGIKLVYTPCLTNAPINGSTRWHKDNPIIQLSGRRKQNDIFWFTLFHEIGHILLHGKKDIFLEDIEYDDKDAEKEKEADEFAADFLLNKNQETELLNDFPISNQKIQYYATKFDVHPAIIIGRLHHKKLIHYSVGREFIENIEIHSDNAIIR